MNQATKFNSTLEKIMKYWDKVRHDAKLDAKYKSYALIVFLFLRVLEIIWVLSPPVLFYMYLTK